MSVIFSNQTKVFYRRGGIGEGVAELYLQSKIGEEPFWIFQILNIWNEEPMVLVHVNHAVF
jgi:hypothetical protein